MAELIPPRRDEFLTKDGVPTQRFAEYLELIAKQTNDNTGGIVTVSDNANLTQIFALENRIGSGDFLTSDETGFTVDTIKLSVDMDEA